MATCTVRARSKAEVPVVMPVRASMCGVNGVACGSTLLPGSGSRCSRSQMAGDMARQRMPQPLRTMKLIASGVTFSAAMTRSPSFSRYSSSTSTIMRPGPQLGQGFLDGAKAFARFRHGSPPVGTITLAGPGIPALL